MDLLSLCRIKHLFLFISSELSGSILNWFSKMCYLSLSSNLICYLWMPLQPHLSSPLLSFLVTSSSFSKSTTRRWLATLTNLEIYMSDAKLRYHITYIQQKLDEKRRGKRICILITYKMKKYMGICIYMQLAGSSYNVNKCSLYTMQTTHVKGNQMS